MGDITTIDLDLAKNVFQVHAVDEAGNVVVRSGCDEAKSSRSLPGFRPAWLDWKPARRHIIGPAN